MRRHPRRFERRPVTQLDLDDRIALVSGASNGIGLAITQTLLEEGARAVAVSRTGLPDLDGLTGELVHATPIS